MNVSEITAFFIIIIIVIIIASIQFKYRYTKLLFVRDEI